MNVVHNLRTNHTDLLDNEIPDTYKIYTQHFEKTITESEFLNTLLKDVEGTITVRANDNSWFDHDITVEYKGHTFDVKKTYKGIFNAHDYSMNRTIAKIPYNSLYGVEPLKKYTFDKLTTAKVLRVFDYEIAYYEWAKIQSLVNIDINLNRVNHGVAMLNRISEAIQTEVKHKGDAYLEEYSVYTPFGVALVTHDKIKEDVYINSNTYHIIVFLDMMKK